MRRAFLAWMVAGGVGAPAWGADALDDAALAAARASRDLDVLLVGPFEDEDLPRVARALGETREARALDRLVLFAGLDDPTVRAAALDGLARVPGGLTPLRAALADEADPAVRTSGWRALGRAGEGPDVEALARALSRAAEEGAAAADGLAQLAIRGVDVSSAIPALVTAVSTPSLLRRPHAAHALYRARPVALDDAAMAQVERAWRTAATPEVKAWLLAVLWDLWPASTRRTVALEVLDDGPRAARAMLLGTLGLTRSAPELVVDLASHPDPWVRQLVGADEPSALPSSTADLIRQAREAPVPLQRTRAAAAALREVDAEGIVALSTAEDPAVRELVADHLATHPDPSMRERIEAALAAEKDLLATRAWLKALAAVATPTTLSPWGAATLRERASTGAFGVRRLAGEVAASLGVDVPHTPPPRPGPPGLARDPRIVSAVVETTEGTFVVALDGEAAPWSATAWAHLASVGDFDGRPWHRVVPGFVAQTGDPRGDGLGHPGWLLPDETSDTPFKAGSVGIARGEPDTGGSQWFVTLQDAPHLAGAYTRIGEVTLGLDVVRRLDPEDRVVRVVVERAPEPVR